ncbi:MAG: hypothetical protein ACI4SY_02000 [Sutterella sp.]
MKKRTKKYRPKPVRVPSIVYRANPITAEQRADCDLFTFVKFDALRRGEGTVEDCSEIQRALYHAWILTRGSKETWEMRMLFTLAFACLNAVSKCLQHGLPIPECVYEPVQMALDVFQDMKDSLDRKEMVDSLRALSDSKEIFYCIAENAGFVVGPNKAATEKVLERRGCGIINHKLRSGFLRRNSNMGNRLEWISPTEDWLTVPVTHQFVLLLTEPLTKEELHG